MFLIHVSNPILMARNGVIALVLDVANHVAHDYLWAFVDTYDLDEAIFVESAQNHGITRPSPLRNRWPPRSPVDVVQTAPDSGRSALHIGFEAVRWLPQATSASVVS